MIATSSLTKHCEANMGEYKCSVQGKATPTIKTPATLLPGTSI